MTSDALIDQSTTPPIQPAQGARTPLFALYLSNTVSAVGDVLTFLAVPWFVLQTTGSVVQTGLTAFFATASVAISALFGSAIVDRLGFRRASVVSDLASAAGVALIPLLYETVGLPFWALLALVFLAGLMTTPGATARAAMVPDLAELAHVRMERATAASDGATRLSRFIGAPLAGVLDRRHRLWQSALDRCGHIRLLRARHRASSCQPCLGRAACSPGDENGGWRLRCSAQAFSGGAARGIRVHPARSDIVLADTGRAGDESARCGQFWVMLPVFVKQTYGSAVWFGAMVAATGGAAFLGTITFGAIGHRLPRQLTLGCRLYDGRRVSPLRDGRFCLRIHSCWWRCLPSADYSSGRSTPSSIPSPMSATPVALRARVFGVLTAGSMLGTPLGGLIAGGIEPGHWH